MARIFDVKEILRFAVQIEKNGELFYRSAARKIKDRKIREIFLRLADDEVKHREFFGGIIAGRGDYEPHEAYPGEYHSYLKAYVANVIFKPAELALAVKRLRGVAEALDFAIQRELESILYYVESKNFVPADQHQGMNRVIAEERSHYRRLSELKKSRR
jgi:rubrerythrin